MGDGYVDFHKECTVKASKASGSSVLQTHNIRIKKSASAQHTGSYIDPTRPLRRFCRACVGGELQYENTFVQQIIVNEN